MNEGTARKASTQPPVVTAQISRPEITRREWITIVPEFPPTDPRAAAQPTPEGRWGNYHATFILSIPGKEMLRDELNFVNIIQSGDSLLTMPTGAAKIQVQIFSDQELKNVFFSANEQGRLSRAEIQMTASNFEDAEKQAVDLVLPILSWWSFRYDVAIDITAYQILEEQTQALKWMIYLVGNIKNLDFNIQGASNPKYRTVFSAYREGVNATNPYYQFLCFYKVIEAVNKLRDQRRSAAKEAGEQYQNPPNENIPATLEDLKTSNPTDVEAFQPYLGQKFTRITDNFRGELRNVIAHIFPDDSSKVPLILDSFGDVMKCERVIPVIRYISRNMLRNEIKADPELGDVHVT